MVFGLVCVFMVFGLVCAFIVIGLVCAGVSYGDSQLEHSLRIIVLTD